LIRRRQHHPPPDWDRQSGGGRFSFEDVDLSDLFANLGRGGARGRRQGANIPIAGQDFEVTAPVTLADACSGTEMDLNLQVPEYDGQARLSSPLMVPPRWMAMVA